MCIRDRKKNPLQYFAVGRQIYFRSYTPFLRAIINYSILVPTFYSFVCPLKEFVKQPRLFPLYCYTKMQISESTLFGIFGGLIRPLWRNINIHKQDTNHTVPLLFLICLSTTKKHRKKTRTVKETVKNICSALYFLCLSNIFYP